MWIIYLVLIIIGGFSLLWLDDKLFRSIQSRATGEQVFEFVRFSVANGLNRSGTFLFHRETGILIVIWKTLTPDIALVGKVDITVETRAAKPMRLRNYFGLIPLLWLEDAIQVPVWMLPRRESGNLLSRTPCGASMSAVIEAVKGAIADALPAGSEVRLDLWRERITGGRLVWGLFDDI